MRDWGRRRLTEIERDLERLGGDWERPRETERNWEGLRETGRD